MTRFPLFVLIGLSVVWPGHVLAAKVIMKDGKTYEGKIIDDTGGDILIKTSPTDARPKLLPAPEVLSVVHDPVAPAALDPQRYTTFEMLLTGSVFSSKHFSLDPAPGAWLGMGLRFHPVVEVGAGLDWKPALSGDLGVTDGVLLRSYERFFFYGGGFSAKVFPFYAKRWPAEPYLIGVYGWDRLSPKGSGDALKGSGFKVGAGTRTPLWKNVFLEARFLFQRVEFDRIYFLRRNGSLDPKILSDSYTLSTGLSVRL
ncbi:MAG: hypothetical protein A2992_09110 [Elusimicrobia bacterium RIFCSPLOWO2_01_FULL_59_12]|nr:MAG: hypothetical protein A2992_09110 [Elusimicrobia bacterium RIFCSPLOWO2_01_FULL_59_12]